MTLVCELQTIHLDPSNDEVIAMTTTVKKAAYITTIGSVYANGKVEFIFC